MCASLHAFWEQILLWIYTSIIKKESTRIELIINFTINRTSALLNIIPNEINHEGIVNYDNIINYLIFLGISKASNNFEIYSNFLNNFFQHKSDYYSLLYEDIHSLHWIYLCKEYINNLKKFNQIFDLTKNNLQRNKMGMLW